MSEQNLNNDLQPEADNFPEPEENSEDIFSDDTTAGKQGSFALFLLPLIFSVLVFIGFTQEPVKQKSVKRSSTEEEVSGKDRKTPKINFSALLAAEEFSKNLRDTVFTAEDIWIELRIDRQTLYVHYRDGRIISYPVSTGISGASKSVESRPGLYAIFLKEEVHLSSQFNNARMNYYMPYNMGIGFHGLPGTGYYGHLGVRPSSHGCIRMRNEDVKVIFGQSKIGTLVLSHKGKSSRVVAFAPKDFKNDAEYTKDDYLNMLAYNLGSIMEGKYFINPPKRFVLDGTVIPRSGINVVSTDNIPERQILPFAVAKIDPLFDKLTNSEIAGNSNVSDLSNNMSDFFGIAGEDSLSSVNVQFAVAPELVKKYVYNPVGVLPYFPPNR
ncbi:MAG: L,D-transpeptidase [Ignavibacteria bacterium]|nr:L,D-transpeptidase [Ignavibacteria bacterium]